ncbi:imidazolonepropionase [Melioribacteraceae bacterium 4301-Me]|uniref:imidazolonepropionase n=1 Tax=Pyranulibacter aquaticus TaxID=3163344 RepID=UPI003599AF7C
MKKILLNPSQIVTVNTNGKNLKRGEELADIEVLTEHSIVTEDEIIKDIIPNSKVNKYKFDLIIDVKNKTILPGLVECHTHTAFIGSRANEFILRTQGLQYEQIANQGGGILSTVKSVRNASYDDLIAAIKPKINNFIQQGITTLEIKSGYGLSYYDEIKLLQVINHFRKTEAIDIVPTFLGAHTFPLEYKNEQEKYIELINKQILPFISKNKLAEFCDAFCEKTAFNPKQISSIFNKALEFGLKLKLHTDQFHSIGGINLTSDYKITSVDHLEAVTEEGINKISKSDTAVVLLPGVSFFLDYEYAPARKLIDSNAIIALSTDYNPGSSNIQNLSLIFDLALIKMKMKPEEIISAYTINAAKALDRNKIIGSIEIGKQADFSVFDVENYNEIFYNIGQNTCNMTIKKGNIIYKKNEKVL